MQPWKLLADPSGYIFGWLVGYSGGLGSIAGVLIADYWLVRQTDLNLADLYRSKGSYGGWNWRAGVATLLGCFFAWSYWILTGINWIWPIFGEDISKSDSTFVWLAKSLFDYGWFVGFGVAFVVHWVLMAAIPPKQRVTAPDVGEVG